MRECGYIGIDKSFKSPVSDIFDYRPHMVQFSGQSGYEPPKKKRKRNQTATSEMEVYDIQKLEERILRFWNDVRTPRIYVLAFKGGVCELNVLKALKIPFFNLEDIKCPPYDELKGEEYDKYACKFHKDRSLHCPLAEVAALKQFYINYCSEKK